VSAPPDDDPEKTAAPARRRSGEPRAVDRPGDSRAATVDVPPAAETGHRAGDLIGRYVIVGVIGAGGMGTVYAAYDPQLDRKVALKFLKNNVGEHNTARLLREAQAMAKLPHPNVVPVHDVGTDHGDVFLAMEFVDGGTVADWLKASPRSWREVLQVFLDAGRGLDAAHRAGLVHRDFKPTNLLIDGQGRVLVTDFGLVCLDGRSATPSPAPARTAPASPMDSSPLSEPLTQAGNILGTPAFMSPEQFDGFADARSDQFCFCVSLYWALYQQLPFDRRETAVLPPLRDAPAGSKVPRWIRQVLLRGMSASPDARYPSMQALLDALGRDPARQRQRWMLGGAVVAILGVTVGLGVRLRRAEQKVCAGAQQKLATVWSAERKDAIARAFLKTGKPYAPDALRTVTAMLDRYARDWADMHQSACEATRVRGEQSEELLDLRMDCLGARAGELGSLAELFSSADGKLVQRSVEAAQALTPLDGCANTVALKTPVRLPGSPEVRAQVEKLRDRLAQDRALQSAGRYGDSLKASQALANDAKAAHYAPIQAQALHLYGQAELATGDTAAAEATLKEALLAAEAGRDDETAARVCMELANTVRETSSRFPEALTWSEHARAWAERTNELDGALAITLERATGSLYEMWGKFAEARPHFERELELSRKVFGNDSSQVGIGLAENGLILYDLGRYDESLRYLEPAVSVQEKAVGKNHPNVGKTLNNLSMVYNELGRFRESVDVLTRARHIFEAAYPPGHRALAAITINLGNAYEMLGRYDEALEILRPQLELDKKAMGPDHPDVADTIAAIASVLNRKAKFEEALPLDEEALRIQEKAYKGEHPSMGDSLLGIGLAWLGLHRPDKAVAPLERASKLVDLQTRVRGRIHLGLALALDGSKRAPLTRVDELMRKAKTDLTLSPAASTDELAQIAGWQRSHPGM
jgi:tetratricopeptide (TPR) repeat protein